MFEENEHCWVLIGESKDDLWWGSMRKMTIGLPTSVMFDPKYVMEREAARHDVVGFYHTHPGMGNHYSDRDDRTMKGWCLCFGKPLVCCILGQDGLTAWWYMDDESPPEEYQAKKVGKLVFGVTPALYEDEDDGIQGD